jgi:DNA repair exonuclease SbcCD nuclease subunit
MRILQLSDTHLGAQRHALGPPGYSRAADHHAALRAALAPALRGEVDLVVHAGDVFDRSRPPRRWMLAAGELLDEVARRVPLVGIAGNHDRRGIRRWLPHASLGFVDQPTRVVVGEVALALVPFVRDAEAFARCAAAAVGKGVDLLVMHQAPHGSVVPGLTFREGAQRDTIGARHLPPGVRHVMCGHIHPRQVVQLGEATVVMGGSTERTAFSERDEVKGTVHWSLSRTVRHRFVDHPTRPMADVPGGLVRCAPEEATALRARGRIPCPASPGRGGRTQRTAGPLFAR